MMGRLFVTVLAVSTYVSAAQSHTSVAYSVRHETGASPEIQASEFVSRMTLEEKAGLLQSDSRAIPRLNIPAYNWWNEGLHGVARAGEATVFPQAIGLAATWNTALVTQVGDVTSTEFRAKYLQTVGADGSSGIYRGLTVWSPNVNIFRDPRWGRGQETYGEDPYLTSLTGVAYIRGLQGKDPAFPKVIATVKHLAVHSGPEADRHREDVHPSTHDLVDTYLPAFHAAITTGQVMSIMCAYNAVDGVPACANTDLLENYVRKQWKFQGYVVSDCGAVADIYSEGAHRYARTPEEAVAAAVKAGTDVTCEFGGAPTADPATTVRAVKQGLVGEGAIDRAVTRLLDARIRLGILGTSGRRPFDAITVADNDTSAHRAINLAAARQSLVLLKNSGLLPLRGEPRRITVIGPNADTVDALVGNYNGTPSYPVTILGGLRARFPKSQITYVEGTGWVSPPLQDIDGASLCVDKACAQPGLKLEHFDNLNLEGQPNTTETISKAVLAWGWPNAYNHKTSARWSGYVRANESGVHNFRLKSDQGYRIRINGQLVTDMWDIAWPTSKTEINLEVGKVYKIEIESQQTGYYGEQRLQWSRPSSNDMAALEAARTADLVIFVSGLSWQLEGEEMAVQAPGFSGGDRTSIDLPAPQEMLLEKISALGKPTILVNMSGSAMALNWADANVPAIIQAWYPGGEGGQAVAELIAGDYSPAGRLPVTFYRSADDLPPFGDYSMKNRTYRYFKGSVLYPFGFGLSYTTFAYDRPKLSRKVVKAGQAAQITVNVTNTGSRDGDEVIQLYTSRPLPGAPIRTLQGFQRMFLRSGESREVTFSIDPKMMSVVDASGNRVVDPGFVKIWIGGGQPVSRPGLPQTAGKETILQVRGRKEIDPF